jgi:uncharacterized protein YndB with AHSA1/START domain
MSERSAVHDTFAIERTYDAPRERVYNAWADAEAKLRWFTGPNEWTQSEREFDFRVGGRERLSVGPAGGPVHHFDAVYQDIVPDERIVYTYDMYMDDQRISVSLATIEFKPEGDGTRLILTEQGVFLDGADYPEQRRQGTGKLLEMLEAELRRETPAAA